MTLPAEELDRWILPLEGWAVERCAISEGFLVELKSGRQRGRLTVQGTFILKAGKGRSTMHHSPPSSMAPALALLGKTVESAVAMKDGRLELKLSGATSISVKPDRSSEAWIVTVGDQLAVVCEPGGRVAVWVEDEP
ncbi:MAG: hypothetical protein HY816_00400 [Candidatus Wallbacteria bacterium]|nr:hypothetical protein [Candidatus Wallbacteria bacterium]